MQNLIAGCDLIPHTSPITWWQNRRATGGLRVNSETHDFLMALDLPRWSFDLQPEWIVPRNVLRMDRLIPVPYSIEIQRPRRCVLTVWDSGQAMTIELMGDFDRFLAALERTWPRNS
jgi:hypothetical protein